MATYIVHGWNEKGTPWVNAEPIYNTVDEALAYIRRLHSQGLLSKARIVDNVGGIMDWPEMTAALAGGSDAGHSGGNGSKS
jgi:hypothetical protein